MKTITLYSRLECCLCDDMKEALERVRATHPFELVVVDLDREAPEEKRAAYTYEVPVLELDGRKVMKIRMDEARLVRLLAL